MYEKELAAITKMLEQQMGSFRRARIGLLFACVGGHLFAGVATFSAAINHHPGWLIMLCFAWAWLVVQTIRVWKLKI